MAARVMIMAGGTGGHVFPALAVARALRERGCEVSWLGSPDSFESRLVPQHGFPLDTIAVHRLRGQGVRGLLFAPFRLLRALCQAARVLRRRRPQVVLGMGGFVAGPGGLVSRLLRIPLVIHEQNTLPGLTNRWLARIATRVLQAFPGTFPESDRVRTCGNPVRREIAELPPPEARMAPSGEAPLRLLVMGGSLGAQALNETVPRALALLDEARRPQVCHQTGRGKLEATLAAYHEAEVEAQVVEFIADMPLALADAELVICRAGALTVSELAAAGLAAVLVPYPHAVDDHQTHNARYLSEAGAAVLLPQTELNPERLAALLGELSDRERLLAMARRARERAMPRAVECVLENCLEVVA
jgi:UDP-N-acetylglucosamine--N-acetylmuramyl-(pentapeptide) pyrophosphoryl-undecaprenol N-acetylglucosamine transferase